MNNQFRSIFELIDYLHDTEKKKVIFGAGKLGTEWGINFFEKNNIIIDAFCDNNNSLWGKIINGKIVYSPKQLADIADNAVVIVILRWDAVPEVLRQLESMGIKDVLDYSSLIKMSGMKELYFPILKQKIAIYTCVTDHYDNLKNHKWLSDKCDYFVITDDKSQETGLFQYLDIRQFLPEDIKDYTRQNRFCKINAHKIFPNYRYSIYADANVVFNRDLLYLIDELPKTRISVAARLLEDDLFAHAIRVINSRRDKPEVVREQLQSYWLQGMPSNYGAFWCNVLIREHNHPICKKIMEEWWEQIQSFSRRDQLSFPYVLWKNGYACEDIGIIDQEFNRTLIPQFWEYSVSHDKPWRIE